ncbi:hypothetical protein K3495_g16724 [Podosphaera aphanis]|nr:hypothetical protein K3495_g16724 [Podosphaera aphanis]
MKIHYDKRHSDIEFNVEDWVMLKTNHIRTLRPCKKLSERQIGPFKIIEKITPLTYRLDLKNLVGKVHDVFHVEKLEKATHPQHQQQEYGMEWFVNDEESFKFIKDITNSRSKHGVFEYEVKLSDDSRLWISKQDLENEEVNIQSFHNRYPEKPKPESMILDRNTRTRKPPARYEDQ